MNEPEVKALISLLDDSDKEVFGHIEEKLISMGNDVIPFLEDAWANAFDPVMQQRIANIVHKIQCRTRWSFTGSGYSEIKWSTYRQ